MGWPPDRVAASSMWKFFAAADGFATAHDADDKSLTEDEVNDLWDWLNEEPDDKSDAPADDGYDPESFL